MIDRWRHSKPKPKTYDWIADALGIAKPHAVHIHHGKAGVGPKLEASIAKRFHAGSHDKLFEEASRWWEYGGGKQAHARRIALTDEQREAVAPADPPDFVKAITLGAYTRETIQMARIRIAEPGVSFEQWVDFLDGIDRENKRFDRRFGPTEAPTPTASEAPELRPISPRGRRLLSPVRTTTAPPPSSSPKK